MSVDEMRRGPWSEPQGPSCVSVLENHITHRMALDRVRAYKFKPRSYYRNSNRLLSFGVWTTHGVVPSLKNNIFKYKCFSSVSSIHTLAETLQPATTIDRQYSVVQMLMVLTTYPQTTDN